MNRTPSTSTKGLRFSTSSPSIAFRLAVEELKEAGTRLSVITNKAASVLQAIDKARVGIEKKQKRLNSAAIQIKQQKK